MDWNDWAPRFDTMGQERTDMEQRSGWPVGEEAIRAELVSRMPSMTSAEFKAAQKATTKRRKSWPWEERWGGSNQPA